MVKFAHLVAAQWNISHTLASELCSAFERGEIPYYLSDYNMAIATELDAFTVWEIFDYLNSIHELAPKKKRALNAVKKAGALSEELEQRIEFTVDSLELDDILIPYRPNPRSKAQLALKKGLGDVVEIIVNQQDGTTSLEELVTPYIGKDASLKTMDDVLEGVRDILAERFAYDDTVRAMAREFCFEDGYVEVVPKNKKDPRFAKFRDKFVPLAEVSEEEFLCLSVAEEKKEVRFKLGVQLFRITEVLRAHFIENHDAVGMDLLCDAIDDSWQRLLFPIVERDIKAQIRTKAEAHVLKQIAVDLDGFLAQKRPSGVVLSIESDSESRMVCIAVDSEGRLLGATEEKKPAVGAGFVSDRIRKLIVRYRPTAVLVPSGESYASVLETVTKTVEAERAGLEIVSVTSQQAGTRCAASPWMKEKNTDLNPTMQKALARAIAYTHPLELIIEIGATYFDLHPKQELVPQERLTEILKRAYVAGALHAGILIREFTDATLKHVTELEQDVLATIRSAGLKETFASKSAVASIKGVSEVLFRNIAGYIVLPDAENVLDKTRVHPQHYEMVERYCAQLNASLEVAVANPSVLLSLDIDNPIEKSFLERKLIYQLEAGAKYLSASAAKQPRKKLRLEELEEGMVLQGKVTNVTQFGVFVNINAVCDGLVHISQLADSFVEKPEQVVALGDAVTVRVVKVDTKKRRISLSMKGLGSQAPKVRPTENQLTNLVDYFSKR
jgi:uncharacterized protein